MRNRIVTAVVSSVLIAGAPGPGAHAVDEVDTIEACQAEAGGALRVAESCLPTEERVGWMADTPDREVVAALGPGGTAFWAGPRIESSGPASRGTTPAVDAGSAVCRTPAVTCFDYGLDVAPGGGRLEVAIDYPSGEEDVFGLELRDPSGTVVDHEYGTIALVPGTGLYSIEVFAPSPLDGSWTVTAIAYDVSDSDFRMRAKLSEQLTGPPPGERKPLLPNIRTIPPFRVGFGACQPSEAAYQYDGARCLRFAQGPVNVGDGPLTLVNHEVGTPGQGSDGRLAVLTGPQYQEIAYSDGTYEERPAGTFEYHVEHGHFHHSATGRWELLRVLPDGQLEPVGASPKHGFCMADFAIADWASFDDGDQRRLIDLNVTDDGKVANCLSPGERRLGLSRGWGDMYSRGTEGNYIDFGSNPDDNRYYLIRATAFPDGGIAETNSDDNVGYTLIRVDGEDVDVCERGIGTSPWDPNRVLVDDRRPPALDSLKDATGSQYDDCSDLL